MASSSDVKDILGGGSREAPPAESPITRDVLLSRAMPPPNSGRASAAKPVGRQPQVKRPKGMARELWSLISADTDTNTLMPTDTAYKQPKARLGPTRVRRWCWTAFRNPARTDQLELRHWRRACDPPAEYSFAKFNKPPDVPDCTEEQLAASPALAQSGWTEAETLHLLELMRRFHMRFVIVLDRWDSEKFGHRTLEDLKERFYGLCRALEAQKAAAAGKPPPRPSFVYDAEHERRRREQLGLLLARTKEEAAEEERLRHELVRIEQRRQDREKKTVHLQRLISQADATAASRRTDTPGSRRSHQAGGGFGGSGSGSGVGGSARKRAAATPSALLDGGAGSGFRFQDGRQAGASLRSARIRLPQLFGQKKARMLDTCLEDLRVDTNPIATEEVADEFNQLRSDILLYSELRTHLQALDYEFQTLKHRYEQLSGKPCPVHWEPYRGRSIGGQAPSGPGTRNKGGAAAAATSAAVAAAVTPGSAAGASTSSSPVLAAGPPGGTPSPTRHKRQAAIGQEQMMKKLKTVGMGRYNVN
ncbi:hypothetical protein BOX15_Mlig027961g1 [Macrostomum lignano]|uniref:Uncharacterized protein n=2 Tax=Macrostomum lignano TaxID=282301 RepID=A0A267FIN2_9PLAT|nr:hypothetical protein BOX15_Mlig027961g1 [Macrostomum lignano]